MEGVLDVEGIDTAMIVVDGAENADDEVLPRLLSCVSGMGKYLSQYSLAEAGLSSGEVGNERVVIDFVDSQSTTQLPFRSGPAAYIVVIIVSLMGLHVILVLLLGILLSGIIGMWNAMKKLGLDCDLNRKIYQDLDKVTLQSPAPVPTITPNTRGYHNLTMGMKGKDVRKLQERLIELGYMPEGSAWISNSPNWLMTVWPALAPP